MRFSSATNGRAKDSLSGAAKSALVASILERLIKKVLCYVPRVSAPLAASKQLVQSVLLQQFRLMLAKQNPQMYYKLSRHYHKHAVLWHKACKI